MTDEELMRIEDVAKLKMWNRRDANNLLVKLIEEIKKRPKFIPPKNRTTSSLKYLPNCS
jgi:hypothetical protein